jgi:hypothetical protein
VRRPSIINLSLGKLGLYVTKCALALDDARELLDLLLGGRWAMRFPTTTTIDRCDPAICNEWQAPTAVTSPVANLPIHLDYVLCEKTQYYQFRGFALEALNPIGSQA